MANDKSQLHQLLAVEGDLDGICKNLQDETIKTFGKSEHFMGSVKSTKMFDENAPVLKDEHKELVTTVPEKLSHLMASVIRYYDCLLQKESTNQIAKADLIVDGIVLAKEVPATFLLGLEHRLKKLRDVYMAIPTLAPGIIWDEDTTAGKGVFRARHDEEVFITNKIVTPVVLYAATDHHPAQVKEMSEDVKVGKRVTIKTCSMISPARKSVLLGRVDSLIQAVKKARMKANCTEVAGGTVGKAIFDYINAE